MPAVAGAQALGAEMFVPRTGSLEFDLPSITGSQAGIRAPSPVRQAPPRGEFQGAWLAWLPTKLCLANDPFAVAPASLAGLVRPGIKEIEKVSDG